MYPIDRFLYTYIEFYIVLKVLIYHFRECEFKNPLPTQPPADGFPQMQQVRPQVTGLRTHNCKTQMEFRAFEFSLAQP